MPEPNFKIPKRTQKNADLVVVTNSDGTDARLEWQPPTKLVDDPENLGKVYLVNA